MGDSLPIHKDRVLQEITIRPCDMKLHGMNTFVGIGLAKKLEESEGSLSDQARRLETRHGYHLVIYVPRLVYPAPSLTLQRLDVKYKFDICLSVVVLDFQGHTTSRIQYSTPTTPAQYCLCHQQRLYSTYMYSTLLVHMDSYIA